MRGEGEAGAGQGLAVAALLILQRGAAPAAAPALAESFLGSCFCLLFEAGVIPLQERPSCVPLDDMDSKAEAGDGAQENVVVRT